MATLPLADRIIVDPNQPNSTPRNLKEVAEGRVLVGQTRKLFDSTSRVWLIIDVELVAAEWMFQFSIENEGKGQREKQETTEIGMVVTSGTETSSTVSASAGFTGWGFSAEVNSSIESKTFNSIETSEKRTVTDTYTCPPESSIFVYKKKYNFRCRTWIYDEGRNVWCETSKGKMESSFVNEIIANQELISPTPLSAHGKLSNNPPSGLLIPQKGGLLPAPGPMVPVALLLMLQFTYPWVFK
jgi:hypothetical protein